jgi:V/A-type H+-transporting ATPase subunit D
MAVLNVNKNRMELMNLKRRLKFAQRGHKLLKDKQDELVRRFLEVVDENKVLRLSVEKEIMKAYSSFIIAKSVMSEEQLEEAIMIPSMDVLLTPGKKAIMNLRVPTFEFETTGDPVCYGFTETSVELDNSIKVFAEVLKKLVRLAEIEKTTVELAEEIIRTRRRVNALEYVLIPNIEETIRYIKMKLDEIERSNLSRLMKVKKIVRENRGM